MSVKMVAMAKLKSTPASVSPGLVLVVVWTTECRCACELHVSCCVSAMALCVDFCTWNWVMAVCCCALFSSCLAWIGEKLKCLRIFMIS